jgi:hypothetical protein
MIDVGDGVYWSRLYSNRCTILLVLVVPVIQSTRFFLSDTRALKILPAADGLN